MKNKAIILISVFSLSFCQAKAIKEKSVWLYDKEIFESIGTADIQKFLDTTENFVIISHDYDFQNDYYGIIIQEFENQRLKAPPRKVSFSPYNAVLMSGKYNTQGANYPIQFNSDFSKLYFSIYEADEMAGTFEWNKIIEYDLINNKIREIATFSDYFPSWYYSEPNNRIYGFDTSTKSMISIDLESTKVKNIHSFGKYFEEIEYHSPNNDSLEIILFKRNENVLRMTIDLATEESFIQDLYSMADFSSYRNGKIVETFKDLRKDIEKLRLYSNDEIKQERFNFKNFNTYWVSDNEFAVMKENKICKIDSELKITNEFEREKIHIIDVLNNSLVVSYYEQETERLGLIDFDFTELVEFSDINISKIVLIKNIKY